MPTGTPLEGSGSGGGGSSGIGTGSATGSGLSARQIKSLVRRLLPEMLHKFGLPARPSNVIRNPLVITSGAFFRRRTVADANYTTVQGDLLVVITSLTAGRTMTATLLSAGGILIFKDESGGAAANNITIQSSSGNIDGAATKVINTNYGAVRMYSDGTNWFTW